MDDGDAAAGAPVVQRGWGGGRGEEARGAGELQQVPQPWVEVAPGERWHLASMKGHVHV